MIKAFELHNYGNIADASVNDLGRINLIIGPNKSGKTFLLKALYSAIKTIEGNGRGRENKTVKELLADKLYWTFQSDPIGNIVKKGKTALSFKMSDEHAMEFSYSFGTSTTKIINSFSNTFPKTDTNSVFIPAKEIVSIRNIIIRNREVDREFGFDDTYYDLAKAIVRTTKGKNYSAFATARQDLNESLGGKLELQDDGTWVFIGDDKRKYDLALTAEGIKKISILDILLGNRYLTNDSIIFIDELEANLHPSLIMSLLEVIGILAEAGVQFFIASHSYFVIKDLYLQAHQKKMPVPVISLDNDTVAVSDLMQGMPKNSIIDESVKLYKKEILL